MSGFGVCITCGGPVERVGWDDECFRCQDEWDEQPGVDEAFEHDACGCQRCQEALLRAGSLASGPSS